MHFLQHLGNTSDRLTEFFFPGFRWRMTAQRLATTEQSVVMSCTRSQSVFATIMFSYSSGPESLKSSAGRFHPSNISFCLVENENEEVSLHNIRSWAKVEATKYGGHGSREWGLVQSLVAEDGWVWVMLPGRENTAVEFRGPQQNGLLICRQFSRLTRAS